MTLKPDCWICPACETIYFQMNPSEQVSMKCPRMYKDSEEFSICSGTLIPMYSQESLVKELKECIKENNSIPKERSFTYERGQNRNEAFQSLLEAITRTEKEGV